MNALEFRVPGPVTPWARTVSLEGGKRLTPKRSRVYRKHLRSCMAIAIMQRPRWPLDARYFVALRAHFKDAKRRDIDNVLKAYLDAGNGILWADDDQVDVCTAVKVLRADRGYADVAVTIVDEERGAHFATYPLARFAHADGVAREGMGTHEQRNVRSV